MPRRQATVSAASVCCTQAAQHSSREVNSLFTWSCRDQISYKRLPPLLAGRPSRKWRAAVSTGAKAKAVMFVDGRPALRRLQLSPTIPHKT
jgi:hypothetical protein